MARVFLSYDHKDEKHALSLLSVLENAGHSVWWDRHIRGGAQYNSEIENAVANADAVVVLWSERAVQSAWVRDEAAEGRDSGKLVPVRLDRTKPPLGFRQFQTIDLSGSAGAKRDSRLNELLDAVEKLGDGVSTRQMPVARPSRSRPRLHLARTAAAVAVLAVMAAAAFFLLRDGRGTPVQTVAVMAVGPSAEPLARDLVVNLAKLQSAKSHSMRLIDGEKGSRADLIFEIGGDIRSPTPAASLVLMAGKDRSILWSENFEQEAGGAAGLKQRAGFSAAQVLGCALETRSPRNGRLRPEQSKLYLNACAMLGESLFHDTSQVISSLQKVVTEAPGFKPAWSKLLVAKTNYFQSLSAAEQTAVAGEFRRTIAAARQAYPDLPEAYIAEIELLPGRAIYDQVRLADRAVAVGADNVFALAGRSVIMLGVGRLEEAVNDSRKTARLDPLSPALRSFYIQALIYSGQIETARSELAEAELLWPDATTIVDARNRLDLRYGNAAEAANALKLMQSGKVKAGPTREAFVLARLNPTEANIELAVERAMSAYASNPEIETTAQVIFALGEFDRSKELFNFLLSLNDESQIPYFVEILFRPPLADLRADPSFMRIAAHFGLLNYWQRSGDWPDFCADPELPYDCKKEASKRSS